MAPGDDRLQDMIVQELDGKLKRGMSSHVVAYLIAHRARTIVTDEVMRNLTRVALGQFASDDHTHRDDSDA